jgi:predicted transcriptional regulator
MSYDKQKSKLKSMSALEESDEVFNAKMQKGLDDARNGRVTPLDDVYAELSKAISELKNGAPVADAEEFIKGLMNS